MSFILDALKKSESDRQRRDTPGIADVPRAQAPVSGPRWLWVLGILLAGNLVAIAAIFLWPDGQPPGGGATAERVATPAPARAAEPQPGPGVIAVPEPEPQPARATARQPETDTQTAAAGPEPAAAIPPPRPAAPARATVSTGLPTFSEVRADGRVTLPDLHLDIHVYSEQPSSRFVFVNMNKYKEDGRLAEGPLVSEITPEGVVLEHMGTEFLLPRK